MKLFNLKGIFKNYVTDCSSFDNLTTIAILSLVIVISGIFGFVYEYVFYFIDSGFKTFYYRGGNFLPWINIYAIGSLFIILLTYKDKYKPIKIFIKSMIICGLLELIAGMTLYYFFGGFRCWNYNTEILSYGSVNGFVCIRSVLFFGLSSLLLVYGILPFCVLISKKMNKKIFIFVSIFLCMIFLTDEIYNLIVARVFSLPRASDIYKSIGIVYKSF